MAKNSLERYTHYYERWASNQVSRQKAMGDLQKMQSEKVRVINLIFEFYFLHLLSTK
jgi:hypothetical protein